jgi:hypothetical protein
MGGRAGAIYGGGVGVDRTGGVIGEDKWPCGYAVTDKGGGKRRSSAANGSLAARLTKERGGRATLRPAQDPSGRYRGSRGPRGP